MADLEIAPQSWIRWNFDVIQGGTPIAQILYPSSWKERGTLHIQGATYQVFREHFMGGEYFLEENGQPVARAQKPSALLNSFNVEYPGNAYTLKKESYVGRSFVLINGDRQAGWVKPQGLLTRKANASLPDEMPLPIQIFVIWLVLVLWKRESDSASVRT